MAADETLQARQAALLVHGLPREARQQVIGRLNAVESSRLKPLLDELDELGLSQTLGQQLSQFAMPSVQMSVVREQTERLNAANVARCLIECAPATAAHLLRTGDWSWRAQALEQMPDAFRKAVLESMRRELTPLAPAVLQALCQRLCLHAAHTRAGYPSIDRSARTFQARFRRLVGWTR